MRENLPARKISTNKVWKSEHNYEQERAVLIAPLLYCDLPLNYELTHLFLQAWVGQVFQHLDLLWAGGLVFLLVQELVSESQVPVSELLVPVLFFGHSPS